MPKTEPDEFDHPKLHVEILLTLGKMAVYLIYSLTAINVLHILAIVGQKMFPHNSTIINICSMIQDRWWIFFGQIGYIIPDWFTWHI